MEGWGDDLGSLVFFVFFSFVCIGGKHCARRSWLGRTLEACEESICATFTLYDGWFVGYIMLETAGRALQAFFKAQPDTHSHSYLVTYIVVIVVKYRPPCIVFTVDESRS